MTVTGQIQWTQPVTFSKVSKNGFMRHNTVAIEENTWFSMGRESITNSQHCGKERQNKNQRRGGKKP